MEEAAIIPPPAVVVVVEEVIVEVINNINKVTVRITFEDKLLLKQLFIIRKCEKFTKDEMKQLYDYYYLSLIMAVVMELSLQVMSLIIIMLLIDNNNNNNNEYYI
jgi:hypothetical protein